jgi:hypothetical protein
VTIIDAVSDRRQTQRQIQHRIQRLNRHPNRLRFLRRIQHLNQRLSCNCCCCCCCCCCRLTLIVTQRTTHTESAATNDVQSHITAHGTTHPLTRFYVLGQTQHQSLRHLTHQHQSLQLPNHQHHNLQHLNPQHRNHQLPNHQHLNHQLPNLQHLNLQHLNLQLPNLHRTRLRNQRRPVRKHTIFGVDLLVCCLTSCGCCRTPLPPKPYTIVCNYVMCCCNVVDACLDLRRRRHSPERRALSQTSTRASHTHTHTHTHTTCSHFNIQRSTS